MEKSHVKYQENPIIFVLIALAAFWIGFPYGVLVNLSKSIQIITNGSLWLFGGIYLFIFINLRLKTIFKVKKISELPVNKLILFLSFAYLSFVFGVITKVLFAGFMSFFD